MNLNQRTNGRKAGRHTDWIHNAQQRADNKAGLWGLQEGNFYIPANIKDSLAVIWLTSVLRLKFYTNPLLQEFLLKRDLNPVVVSFSSQPLTLSVSLLNHSLSLVAKKQSGVSESRSWVSRDIRSVLVYVYMCICEHVIKYEAKFVFGCLCHVLWCVSFNLSVSCSVCPCVLLCIRVYTVLLCVYVCAGRY